MASRGARKAAQNKKTKAAHAARTKAHWDELGQGEKVEWSDIGQAAAGAIPFVGGALAAKDLARGAAITGGTAVGAAGDALEAGGKAGLKSAGKAAAGALGTVAGIVGAADAAVGAGKLFNKKQYQELSPEEQQARRTITSSQRRGSRRRSSPTTRMESPFKQSSFNPYAYQDKFAGAGDAAAAAIEEQRALEREVRQREREELQDAMQRQAFAEAKAKQQEALIVAGDTGFNNVDLAVNQASRQLVDQAAALTAQLNKGEITADEWASQTALIRKQVPGINAWKETLTNNLGAYVEATATGGISKAMNPEYMAVYNSLMKDDGTFSLAVNENGQVVFEGTSELGENVSVPVNGMGTVSYTHLTLPTIYSV